MGDDDGVEYYTHPSAASSSGSGGGGTAEGEALSGEGSGRDHRQHWSIKYSPRMMTTTNVAMKRGLIEPSS